MKHFYQPTEIDAQKIRFTLGTDRTNRPTIAMGYEPTGELAMVSAPAITMYPRCSGDGNFGTMFGPTDPMKAKYTIDLTDSYINGQPNDDFTAFAQVMEQIDDALLEFVTENQMKILGRKQLSKDEVKMLQVRSVRPKFDKVTGNPVGCSIDMKTSKYQGDGMGGKYVKPITVCDHQGKALEHGQVAPGDVVSVTFSCNMVYTGVGGDKFGISWGFHDVAVICQRSHLEAKSEVPAFMECKWSMGQPYQVSETPMSYAAAGTEQFACG